MKFEIQIEFSTLFSTSEIHIEFLSFFLENVEETSIQFSQSWNKEMEWKFNKETKKEDYG